MKNLIVAFLLLTVLALVVGGCKPQPPAQAQAEFVVEFTLTTSMHTGKMVFVGVGGEIDGLNNPDLLARQGDIVHITLVNGDGMPHDLAIPDLNAQTIIVTAKGKTTDVVFETNGTGEFAYYCTISGHRQAGMEGKLIVQNP
jgi:nitrite reductase (NO-forming)